MHVSKAATTTTQYNPTKAKEKRKKKRKEAVVSLISSTIVKRIFLPQSFPYCSLLSITLPMAFSPPHSIPKLPKMPLSSSTIPTMSEILETSREQGLRLQLRALGPFYRVEAEGERGEVGRAEGVIRRWVGGKVLHLDSIRMTKETLAMDRSVFGLGLFLGAVAVRHGFDRGCDRAELLAINDSPIYHSKLVCFYTRMGFRAVHEVDGSSMGDLVHMLVWGGRGTRMDADIKELLVKWSKRFRPRN